MTSTAPEPAPSLRDRLYATLDPKVDKTLPTVEAVCDDLVSWLREQADDWHQRAAAEIDVMGYGKAAALMLQGFADGIEAGRPNLVATQDLGVQ